MDSPKIEQSSDYSIFNQVGFNRDKNQRHIRKLKEAILRENLLHLHPILVNEKMEVIDGQHRLEVAKELGIAIFYIKSNLSYDHIIYSNILQNDLSLEDIIKFYTKKDGSTAYIKLHDYLKSTGMKPKCFFGLVFGGTSKPILEFIKSGKFKFPDDMTIIDKLVYSYCDFIQFIKSKKITPFSMFSTANFTIGYRNLILLSSFNESVFYSKIEQRWFDLKPQINSVEWTKQMIGIYNWKNHNPLQLNEG